MPGRKAKPPRLWFRDDAACWIILDRKRQVSTGCGRDDTEGAAQALEAYLAERHVPAAGSSDPRVIPIADVLAAYGLAKKPKAEADRWTAEQHELLMIRLLDLNAFFGELKVADIKAQLCRDFVDWSTGTPNQNNDRRGVAPRATTQATSSSVQPTGSELVDQSPFASKRSGTDCQLAAFESGPTSPIAGSLSPQPMIRSSHSRVTIVSLLSSTT